MMMTMMMLHGKSVVAMSYKSYTRQSKEITASKTFTLLCSMTEEINHDVSCGHWE